MTAKALSQRDLATVIGLEVHVQLETDTKIFCGCSTDAAEDEEPNTRTCPVCLGLPGALPVLNEGAVEAAVKVGKALDATVAEQTRFHRKNYYYPDLPKNFQITQYDAPICADGTLEVSVEGDRREVGIERAHLEEDPGSLQHKGGSIDTADYTLVNYNRAGTPLMEIVTKPDFRSPQETRAFLAKLEEVLEYLGVFDATRDGSLRIDANISMVPDDEVADDGSISEDALASANRTEVKNISSHKGAEKALAYEVTRQKNAIERGRAVEQETRHWDESRGITVSMRSKEEEKDYRYFREADLPPLEVADWKERIDIPELPDARRERFQAEYGLDAESASKLTSTKEVADFYEDVAEEFDPDLAATWVADNLLGELNYRDMQITDVTHRLDEFTRLVELVAEGEITTKNAEEIVLRRMLDEGDAPDEIVEAEGLGAADDDEVVTAVSAAIEENPDAVADYHAGEGGAINFLVGQVMQKTGGSADPGDVNQMLRDELDE
ncbi:aspartyl/glutamyl-tRNA(Asn/Gln) amidotransferase subunit B [Halogeometricum rufum]|uniref:Aspartyl/glutamyl-tRNA(Asn/Gln) amidotransferase subunit B n=1 Tax=Halogeometricum rufum TaxID=553469 RepID=A0A1I6GCK3_9EURY|nr:MULTISPECIES: Asp-tRNA(Asn)/Glu-tRNA(Gln) amidotransferase subunit GatB [Halogeometricum]MUV58001.1 Asp-tRNA(Asn)/Glu-tRNA(Gln) amidotransferase subunit GatB [Halogeometricum sp. CBA1124]SFR39916.1 aspartyl/glutamyl-tRNA(Asn/Gln) amidotransferase subunit B [Halogeometricum rufum]